MADITLLAAGVISVSGQVGCSVCKLIKALSNFNYQLISSLMRLISEGCGAICVFFGAISNASYEITIYLYDLLAEFAIFFHMFLRLMGQLAITIAYVLQWLYGILEVTVFILAELIQTAITSCIVTLCDVAVPLEVVLSNIAGWVKLSAISYCNQIETLSSQSIECFNASISSLSYLIHGPATIWMYIADGTNTTYNFCADSIEVLCIHIVHICEISWINDNTCIPKAISILLSGDMFSTIAIFVILILFLQVIITQLRNHGLTVPFFSTCISHHISQVDWIDGAIIVSDEEEEDNSENAISETDSNSYTSDDSTSQLSNDYISDTDTSVEEFEIADGDSDFESGDENDQNVINIQLPVQTTPYGLRNRPTPSPARSMTKLSSHQLERVLENERDKRMCVVCQNNAKNVLVLPCKHMCMCVTCAHQVATARRRNRRICPLCRSHIDTVMDVFV